MIIQQWWWWWCSTSMCIGSYALISSLSLNIKWYIFKYLIQSGHLKFLLGIFLSVIFQHFYIIMLKVRFVISCNLRSWNVWSEILMFRLNGVFWTQKKTATNQHRAIKVNKSEIHYRIQKKKNLSIFPW